VTAGSQASHWPVSALPAAYMRPGNASFTEFLSAAEPHLLPGAGSTESFAGALPLKSAPRFVDIFFGLKAGSLPYTKFE